MLNRNNNNQALFFQIPGRQIPHLSLKDKLEFDGGIVMCGITTDL